MKIAVCIKQVPTREWQPRLTDDKRWVRDADISYEMNEPDAYALEEALRLKEKHGGEVVVVSAGPARAQQVIREALARGADRAIHVQDDALGTADAWAGAVAVAEAVKDDAFDVVLTGLQSDDQGHGQFGPVLAERLGMPHSTIIMEVQITDGVLRAKRELEGGWFQYVSMPLPALLTIQSGINQLRYATLKGIMAAEEEGGPGGGAAGRRWRHASRWWRSRRRRSRSRPVMITGLAAGSRARTRASPARRGARPMILVISEQKDGKLNRASWEAIAAAQALAARQRADYGGRLRRRTSTPRPRNWRPLTWPRSGR